MKVGRFLIAGAFLSALTACASQVPDSGAGVGFNDYAQYEVERARREAALTGAGSGAPLGAAQTGGFAAAQPVTSNAIPSSELAAAGIGTGATAAPVATTGLIAPAPGNAATPRLNNPGISDEQDFSAVSGRETMESDAARLARNAANYEVVGATAVPDRNGNEGPNIVDFAINAPNAKGQEWYSRSTLSGQGRFQRNCAKYRSPDAAQRDFLARGGPERDRMGIDPDGDGFACGWDPAPFRLARSAGN